MSETQPVYAPSEVSDDDIPTLQPLVLPLPPADRRVQHNNALRSLVHLGNLLAERLQEKIATQVDFDSEGRILAWQHALNHLRSFQK